jgi:TonB-dependent starch-binding outer membrane protein SusC
MKKLTTLLAIIIFSGMQILSAQALKITGKVADANTGEPLPGVNVIQKGTTTGVMTGADGTFTMSVTNTESVLVFSFIGYVSQEIAVGNQSVINVSLTEDIKQVDEVVVIGYGSMQRSNVTGSISSVKADDLKRTPVPNAIEAIRGQVPGVRITRGDGTPGSDVSLTIRGVRSLGAASKEDDPDYVNSNAPLIVVDGVPYSGGKISDINPDDIASMDILKDAAATSVYGSSAANGVILITTKSGSTGKASLTVSASTGITDLVQKPTLYDGKGFAQLKIDALEGNRKNTKALVPESVLDPIELANYYAGNNLDMHDVMLRQGKINQANVSLTGGTDKFHYYLNGEAYNETGIVQHMSYDRYSFRLNSDYTPYKFVTIGAKVQYVVTKSDETGNTMGPDNKTDFTDFIGNSPLGRLRDSLGNLTPTVNGDQFQYNPLYRYEHSDAGRQTYRASVTPFIEFKIIDGLTYRINGFAETRSERFTRFLDGKYDAQNIGYCNYKIDFGQENNYLFDNILNYNRTFFDKHMLNLTAVYGFQTGRGEDFIITAEDNIKNYIGIYDIENVDRAGARNYKTELNPTQSGKAYYVGRLAYSFDNRFNLTASARWDYTSQFGPDNKKGFFPSVAAAWNIHNESFLQNLSIINVLKYRISYGEVGNDRIPDFKYLFSAKPSNYIFAGTSYAGWTNDRSGNYSLKWETSQQFNTGLDFGILQNRVTGSFDYYSTVNKDILYNEQVPIIYGDSKGLIMSNVAETKGWGLGAILTVKILDGAFKWETSANWSKDKNEIVNLGGKKVDSNGNPIDDVANGWFIGQDINVIYDYKFIGIYQEADTAIARKRHSDKISYGAGDPIIADIDGNDTINAEDKTFLGSSKTPDWYGGWSNTFSFMGFELNILFETVQGIKRVNYFINSLNGRDNTVVVNYWTPRNTSGDFPQPYNSGIYDYDRAVRLTDASFIALRNVSLTYNLPQSILKKTPLKNVSIYVRGNNLKYFTDFKQTYSPEFDFGRFPVTKTWSTGLNITF